jgi:release factor glutamine methyltransferase
LPISNLRFQIPNPKSARQIRIPQSEIPMPTIAEAIARGAQKLRASGVNEERRAAGILLCHALGIDRTHLLTRSSEQVDEARYESYLASVVRRAAGEPLQYITGHQEFYGLDFIVTPDVLIPRPETEFLVERVIELYRAGHAEAPPIIADIGTGSGCIAVTLAYHIPGARVIAIDISSAALDVARANAERHDVEDSAARRGGLRGQLIFSHRTRLMSKEQSLKRFSARCATGNRLQPSMAARTD